MPVPPCSVDLALDHVPRSLLFFKHTFFPPGYHVPTRTMPPSEDVIRNQEAPGMENMVQLTDNRTSKGTITSISNPSHPQIDLCTHAAHPNTTTSTAATLHTCRIYTVHGLCPGIIMDCKYSAGGQRSCQIGGHVGRRRTRFFFSPSPNEA